MVKQMRDTGLQNREIQDYNTTGIQDCSTTEEHKTTLQDYRVINDT